MATVTTAEQTAALVDLMGAGTLAELETAWARCRSTGADVVEGVRLQASPGDPFTFLSPRWFYWTRQRAFLRVENPRRAA